MKNKLPIRCEHWQDCGVIDGGCCEINKYDKPSFGVCLLICSENTNKPSARKARKKLGIKKKSRGFGDTVKKVIDTFTGEKVKQCGGCKKRQEALNKMMPYNKNQKS